MKINKIFHLKLTQNEVHFIDDEGFACNLNALNEEGWSFVQSFFMRDKETDILATLAVFEKEKS